MYDCVYVMYVNVDMCMPCHACRGQKNFRIHSLPHCGSWGHLPWVIWLTLHVPLPPEHFTDPKVLLMSHTTDFYSSLN